VCRDGGADPTVAVPEFAVGLLALFSMSQKPGEISGRWKAIAGIIFSLAAVGIGLFFIIARHSAPPA